MVKEIVRSTQFKKDYKLAIKRGCKEDDIKKVLSILAEQKTLPKEYLDHPLNDSKHYKNARECHIYPDWLLVYRYTNKKLVLELIRTGTHSDLFNC